MKVTVSFGDVRVIVPCGKGELTVEQLMVMASNRYKKAIGKPTTYWVNIQNLQNALNGGLLDPDDVLSDVVDDKEQLVAIYEEAETPLPARPLTNGDGTSASSSPDPELTTAAPANSVTTPPSRVNRLTDASLYPIRSNGAPSSAPATEAPVPATNTDGDEDEPVSPEGILVTEQDVCGPHVGNLRVRVRRNSDPTEAEQQSQQQESTVDQPPAINVTFAGGASSADRVDDSPQKRLGSLALTNGAVSSDDTSSSFFVRNSGFRRSGHQVIQNVYRWLDTHQPSPMTGVQLDARQDPEGHRLSPQQQSSTVVSPEQDLPIPTLSTIVLKNPGGPLGVHVVPEHDQVSQEAIGLTIESVEPGSLVERDGRLQRGDLIRAINGVPLSGVSFDDARAIFKDALKSDEVQLEVVMRLRKTGPPVLPKPKNLPPRLNVVPSIAELSTPEETDNGDQEPLSATATATAAPATPDKQPASVPATSTPTGSEDLSTPLPLNGELELSPMIKSPGQTSVGIEVPASSVESARTVSGSLRRSGKRIAIRLVKGETGLGFSISTRDNPTPNSCNVYVKKIQPHGAAVAEGTLRQNDRLIRVNEVDLTGYSQEKAAELLKSFRTGDTVELVVMRQPASLANELKADRRFDVPRPLTEDTPPSPAFEYPSSPTVNSSFFENSLLSTPSRHKQILSLNIPLNDTGSAGLGVGVKGPRHQGRDLGIFVKNVINGGAAQKDGRLQVNDQLIAVNGHSLQGLRNEEAKEVLRKAMQLPGPMPGHVMLVVQRFDSGSIHQQSLFDFNLSPKGAGDGCAIFDQSDATNGVLLRRHELRSLTDLTDGNGQSRLGNDVRAQLQPRPKSAMAPVGPTDRPADVRRHSLRGGQEIVPIDSLEQLEAVLASGASGRGHVSVGDKEPDVAYAEPDSKVTPASGEQFVREAPHRRSMSEKRKLAHDDPTHFETYQRIMAARQASISQPSQSSSFHALASTVPSLAVAEPVPLATFSARRDLCRSLDRLANNTASGMTRRSTTPETFTTPRLLPNRWRSSPYFAAAVDVPTDHFTTQDTIEEEPDGCGRQMNSSYRVALQLDESMTPVLATAGRSSATPDSSCHASPHRSSAKPSLTSGYHSEPCYSHESIESLSPSSGSSTASTGHRSPLPAPSESEVSHTQQQWPLEFLPRNHMARLPSRTTNISRGFSSDQLDTDKVVHLRDPPKPMLDCSGGAGKLNDLDCLADGNGSGACLPRRQARPRSLKAFFCPAPARTSSDGSSDATTTPTVSKAADVVDVAAIAAGFTAGGSGRRYERNNRRVPVRGDHGLATWTPITRRRRALDPALYGSNDKVMECASDFPNPKPTQLTPVGIPDVQRVNLPVTSDERLAAAAASQQPHNQHLLNACAPYSAVGSSGVAIHPASTVFQPANTLAYSDASTTRLRSNSANSINRFDGADWSGPALPVTTSRPVVEPTVLQPLTRDPTQRESFRRAVERSNEPANPPVFNGHLANSKASKEKKSSSSVSGSVKQKKPKSESKSGLFSLFRRSKSQPKHLAPDSAAAPSPSPEPVKQSTVKTSSVLPATGAFVPPPPRVPARLPYSQSLSNVPPSGSAGNGSAGNARNLPYYTGDVERSMDLARSTEPTCATTTMSAAAAGSEPRYMNLSEILRSRGRPPPIANTQSASALMSRSHTSGELGANAPSHGLQPSASAGLAPQPVQRRPHLPSTASQTPSIHSHASTSTYVQYSLDSETAARISALRGLTRPHHPPAYQSSVDSGGAPISGSGLYSAHLVGLSNAGVGQHQQLQQTQLPSYSQLSYQQQQTSSSRLMTNSYPSSGEIGQDSLFYPDPVYGASLGPQMQARQPSQVIPSGPVAPPPFNRVPSMPIHPQLHVHHSQPPPSLTQRSQFAAPTPPTHYATRAAYPFVNIRPPPPLPPPPQQQQLLQPQQRHQLSQSQLTSRAPTVPSSYYSYSGNGGFSNGYPPSQLPAWTAGQNRPLTAAMGSYPNGTANGRLSYASHLESAPFSRTLLPPSAPTQRSQLVT